MANNEVKRIIENIELPQCSSMLLYLLYYKDIHQNDPVFKDFKDVDGVMYSLVIQGLAEYKNIKIDAQSYCDETWSITHKGKLLINKITS